MEEKKVLEEQKKRLLELFHHKDYVPMKVKELAILFGVPREERPALQAVLDALLSEGKIGISKRGKYALAENFLITGTFLGNKKGFGFVTRETEPGKEKQQDLFIPETETGTAMDGDTVRQRCFTDIPTGAEKIPRAVWCGYWNAPINRSWLPMKNVRISALPCR